ncbi:hypothetical protein U1Q18_032623 [Sarracenia purpurea var. burkii]
MQLYAKQHNDAKLLVEIIKLLKRNDFPMQPGTTDIVFRNDSISASLVASELNIPGLYLWHDFITAMEEEVGYRVRFGLVQGVPADKELKKKARLDRFAAVPKTDSQEEEKKESKGFKVCLNATVLATVLPVLCSSW